MEASETEVDMDASEMDLAVDVPGYGSLKKDDVLALTFQTADAGEEFYDAYSAAVGFGWRKGDLYRGEEGLIRSREWVCCKEGVRQKKHLDAAPSLSRNPRKETRTDCKARLRIGYDDRSKVYVVKIFVAEHNHPLATKNQIGFVRAHRRVSDAALALTNTMTKVSIRPCHTFEYMVEQAGGYSVVGFTMKDLYNKLDQQRRNEPFESDSEGAISYMRALASKDPHFICRFTTDPDHRLVDMFWRDGHSFVDYQCYGDVLIFDSTYKTNIYSRPLVLFVGTNNHRGSIIFGAALISNETEESYTWLLRVFLESMNGKMPKAVLTDSDESMRNAIQTVMPEVRHRLCIWHINKNANSHLKSEKANSAFKRCVRKYQTVEQFERLWQEMIDEHDLRDNSWISEMYAKRDKFCQAFFSDIFMAGMRSTQRCEGMNKDFKRVLGKGKSLTELVTLICRLLMKVRHNQERDEFNNMNSSPCAVTHLVDLEKQASSIFTHDVFKWILKEIKKESCTTLNEGVERCEDGSRVYKISCYKRPDFHHTVVYHPEKETDSVEDPIMVCSCRMFQYRGVPCRHMFTVMKNEHISELHKSLIVKRWSKDARSVCEIPYPDQSMPREAVEVSRYGGLNAECTRLCFYASKTDAGYNLVLKELSRLSSIVEGFAAEKEKQKERENVGAPATPGGSVVRDPIPFRTKGREKKKPEAPRRPITCGYCQGIGHNSQTCHARKENEREEAEERYESDDEGNTDPPSTPKPAKRTVTCGYCKGTGHNSQTCEVRKEKEKEEAEESYESDEGNTDPPSTPRPAKRTVTCGYCQGTGHNSQTCEVRKEKEKAEKSDENDERNDEPSPSVATPAKRSCHYCKGTGHYAKTCRLRKSRQQGD